MRAVEGDPDPLQGPVAGKGALGVDAVATPRVVDPVGLPDPLRAGPRPVDGLAPEQRLDLGLDRVGQLEAVAREELDSVVLVGIVRGRDHDPGVGPHVADQERDPRGGEGADEDGIRAHRHQTALQRRLEHVAREPGVLADEDPGPGDSRPGPRSRAPRGASGRGPPRDG